MPSQVRADLDDGRLAAEPVVHLREFQADVTQQFSFPPLLGVALVRDQPGRFR